MKTFKLVISTPGGNFFDGDIAKISLRGIEGDLAIMANHTPFVTSVKPCNAHIEFEDGTVKSFNVQRGLVSVALDKVTLMSGSVKWE